MISRALRLLPALACLALLEACGGHAAEVVAVRSALDRGRPEEAVNALGKLLDVSSPDQLPSRLTGDKALFVLDRATIQQELGKYEPSKRDYQAVDKAIDVLDFSRDASDSLGEYLFSDSAGTYRAPPTERLMLNAMNMINYLETGDREGALVEARRFSVVQKFVADKSDEKSASEGFGSLLAGTAYESAGNVDEALHYYDDALALAPLTSIGPAIRRLRATGTYRSERFRKFESTEAAAPSEPMGELVIVVGYGRVPPKVAVRVPIGLALTWVAGGISPANHARANALAAQGLVTWVNYPTLGEEQGAYEMPTVRIDGAAGPALDVFSISSDVRAEWQSVEGRVIASAITRLIARAAVGAGIRAAAGRDRSGLGLLASLAAQATLTGLDTPDTRSWETLPARVAYTRIALPPGVHRIFLAARGRERRGEITIEPNRVTFVSLVALR